MYTLCFVPDGMTKRDGSSIIYGRSIDAATLEFIYECQVVIGTHRGPTSILDLTVEKALAMASGEAES